MMLIVMMRYQRFILMKSFLFGGAFLAVTCFFTAASDLQDLQGTWIAKKKGDNGMLTQTLTFAKEKWTFQLDSEGGGGFVAKGDAEFKKAGVFDTVRFHVTKFGPSESELGDSDTERHMVFSIQDGKLHIANNLDRQREYENPIIDVYSKAAEAAKGSSELIGNWKLDLELGENKYDYTLRVTESAGKLSAVVVSPRSGEYKAKTISFESNAFKLEVDRVIENNAVTFVYTGKLEGKKLSGSVAVKREGEEIASGTWAATK